MAVRLFGARLQGPGARMTRSSSSSTLADGRKGMAHLLFIIVSLIWSSNFIMMKKASLAFGPISIGAWRVFGGGLILAVVWFWKVRRWPFGKTDLGPLLFLSVVGYAWPFCVLPHIIARNGGAFGGMMIGLVPLMTILVSVPMLSIRPTRKQVVGVLGGLGCLAVIMFEGLRHTVTVLDACLGVSVPFCYACGNTLIKRRFPNHSPLHLSSAALLLTSVLLIPLAWWREEVRLGDDFTLAVLCLAGVVVLSTGLCVYLFYRLIQVHGPLYAGMVAYVIPLGALVWGWFDRETVSPLQVAALLGILAMVAIVQTGGSRPPVRTGDSGRGATGWS